MTNGNDSAFSLSDETIEKIEKGYWFEFGA
jgi:hypothetical protein